MAATSPPQPVFPLRNAPCCADCGAPIAPAQIYRSHIGTPRERTHCEECSRFKANAQAFVHVVQRRFAFEWGRSL